MLWRQGRENLAHLTSASAQLTSAACYIKQLLKNSDTKNHDNISLHITQSYKKIGDLSFAIQKGKQKEKWALWLSHRDWCAAGGCRACLSLSNHCTLSRPLQRVRGSLWLQDNFPHQDLVNHTNWVWQFCDGDCSTLPQTLVWSRQDSKSSFQNYFLNHIAISRYNDYNSDHFLTWEKCHKTATYEVILQ